MRVLATSEVTFEIKVEPDDTPIEGNVLASGNDAEDRDAEEEVRRRLNSGDETAWCGIVVSAIWKSPTGSRYEGRDSLWAVTLTESWTMEEVVRTHDMRNLALGALNEQLRALFIEMEAIRKHLMSDVFEVVAGGSVEGCFPDRKGAERYAEQLRKELGAQRVEVRPSSPSKVRSLLDAPKQDG